MLLSKGVLEPVLVLSTVLDWLLNILSNQFIFYIRCLSILYKKCAIEVMPKKPVPRPEDEESHLKKLREELEMSQEDLARELGVSSQTISRWELGKNVPTFTVKQMKALEKLLASIGRLIGDLPDNL
jgi:DNA-binding XRE family transcriptional regulator